MKPMWEKEKIPEKISGCYQSIQKSYSYNHKEIKTEEIITGGDPQIKVPIVR
jgi:hypothetical protein